MRKRLCSCLVLVLVVAASANVASGAGFSMYPAVLQGKTVPGASGSFPGYKIVNGTGAFFQITMSAQIDPTSAYLWPPSEWFGFNPKEFVLGPGEEKTVELLVSIPSETAPGEYETLIQAKAQGTTEAVMNINVALNARLRLTVSQPVPIETQEDNPLYIPVASKTPSSVKRSVLPDSETRITTVDENLTVTVPPSLVDGSVRISTIAWSAPIDDDAAYKPLSLPYHIELGEDNTRLSKPYRITCVLPSEDGIDLDSAYLCLWNEGLSGWIALPAIVGGEGMAVSAEADRPGTFALMHRPDLPKLTDIKTHQSEAQILEMVSRGVVNGAENNLFKPESPVTRAQFAKMISIALRLVEKQNTLTAALEFRDDIPEWAKPHVIATVGAGLFRGDENGRFNPDTVITRQEMACVLARALPSPGAVDEGVLALYTDAHLIPAWAAGAVAVVTANHLMNEPESGTFNPTDAVNRGEACDFLARLLDLTNGER